MPTTPRGYPLLTAAQQYALVTDYNKLATKADAEATVTEARAQEVADKAVADAGALSRKALNEMPGRVASEVDRVIGDTREDAAEALATANKAYEYNQALVAPAADVVNAVVTDPSTPAGSAVAAAAAAAQDVAAAVKARAHLVQPAGGTDDATHLQAAVDDAGAAGAPLVVRGDFRVAAGVTLPAGSRIDADGATIRQTGSTRHSVLTVDAENISISGLTVLGVPSRYVNNTTVYQDAGVNVKSGARNVKLRNLSILEMPGACVQLQPGCDGIDVTDCTLTGAGRTYITGQTFYQGSGIRVMTTGRWRAHRNDISLTTQGINTGMGVHSLDIQGNQIHDILGQHGLYLEQVTLGGVVAGNLIYDTVLCSMKIQLGGGSDHSEDVVIAQNVFKRAGNQGLLLTQTDPSATGQNRGVAVTGNVVSSAALDGININRASDVEITGNIIRNSGRHGLTLDALHDVGLTGNRIAVAQDTGLLLTNARSVRVDGLQVRDAGRLGNNSTAHGVMIGAGSSDVSLHAVRAVDSASVAVDRRMRYGVYVQSGADQSTIDFVDVTGVGREYGLRGNATTPARRWRGNDWRGGSGATLTAPTTGSVA